MVTASITSAAFDARQTASYDLYLSAEPRQVSYAIVNRSGQVLQLECYDYPANNKVQPTLKQVLQFGLTEMTALKYNFRSITVSIESTDFSSIPLKLYKPEQNESYFQLLRDSIDADTHIRHDVLLDELVVLYPIKDSVVQLLKRELPKAKIWFYFSSLLQLYTQVAQQSEESKVFLHFCEQRMFIAFFRQKKPTFVNHYSFSSATDCLYFVMLIFEQFKLKQEEVPVIISGLLLKESRIYSLLFRYIRQLHFLDEYGDAEVLPKLEKEPTYLYAQLLSLQLCAL